MVDPIFLKDILVDYIGGDGSGEIVVNSGVTLTLAEEFTRTYIRSSMLIEGTVVFPSTTYTEQNLTNYGQMIGAEHWYTRGYTGLTSYGQSKCSTASVSVSEYFFSTFTVLSGGIFRYVL